MDKENQLCLVVPRDKVEKVRKKLSKANALDRGHRIDVVEGTAFIPILVVPEDVVFPTEEHLCSILYSRPSSYKEILDLPVEVIEMLPSSYDIVGTLAVIRLPEEVLEHRTQIGNALKDFLPSVSTVLMDNGVEGEWRIRQLELLVGENTTKTIHREHGVDMVVDLSRAYFSPRLAAEHWRVAEMVCDGEVILDMFAGIGPFPLVIAKHCAPKEIIAVDINPGAIALLRESIERNSLENITSIVEDARKVASTTKADRIIMNLPHGARRFLPDAIAALNDGGMIHCHEIVDTSKLDEVKKDISRLGLEIVFIREVRTYAPGQVHFVFDLIKEI